MLQKYKTFHRKHLSFNRHFSFQIIHSPLLVYKWPALEMLMSRTYEFVIAFLIRCHFLKSKIENTVGNCFLLLFIVFPNPVRGDIIVEGTDQLVITSVLWQTILIRKIDSQTTLKLPQRTYFAKLCNTIRKIVVE